MHIDIEIVDRYSFKCQQKVNANPTRHYVETTTTLVIRRTRRKRTLVIQNLVLLKRFQRRTWVPRRINQPWRRQPRNNPRPGSEQRQKAHTGFLKPIGWREPITVGLAVNNNYVISLHLRKVLTSRHTWGFFSRFATDRVWYRVQALAGGSVIQELIAECLPSWSVPGLSDTCSIRFQRKVGRSANSFR